MTVLLFAGVQVCRVKAQIQVIQVGTGLVVEFYR